jgi:hypothetical protein
MALMTPSACPGGSVPPHDNSSASVHGVYYPVDTTIKETLPVATECLAFRLSRGYTRFTASIGIEDGSKYPATFALELDGVTVTYNTAHVGTAPAWYDIPLGAADELTIVTKLSDAPASAWTTVVIIRPTLSN